MGKYSKYYSNYILRKKHQNIKDGEIFERDWTTLSERHSLEKGKTPIYSDGNFLFTINNSIQQKHYINNRYWDYNDVGYEDLNKTNSKWNKHVIDYNSNDLRDFAYYGSCTEMLRSSITNIINNFPCCIKSGSIKIYSSSNDYDDIIDGDINDGKFAQYVLNNPFEVDFIHTDMTLGLDDNEMRFLALSYKKYKINGKNIIKYNLTINEDSICNDNKRIAKLILSTIGEEYNFNIYKSGKSYVVSCLRNDIFIEPIDDVFNEYINSLEGIDKILLNYNTKPTYTCRLITPVYKNLIIKYGEKSYTWPSDGKYIIINSKSYEDYVNKLLNITSIFDDIWCDNIYRSMAHESIKNFDWSYTRSYEDGEEQDNIDGGNRISNLLRIYGRGFDDIKRYIDSINFTNNVTYDKLNNTCEAELSEKLENHGWDVKNIDETLNVGDVLNDNIISDNVKWYGSLKTSYVDTNYTNSEFIKKLLISSNYILNSKGTIDSIEMIMALFGLGKGTDYDIIEHYYSVIPKTVDEMLDDGTTIIDKIEELNIDNRYFNENEGVLSGINIKEISYNKNNVLVPYFDKRKKYYNNELYFQGKGGWGFDGYNYAETIPYLNRLNEIKDLCNVSPNSVRLDEIFYVNDISEYYDINVDPSDYTNFFYVRNLNTNDISAWRNIRKSWGNINNPTTDEDAKKKKMYDRSIYLYSIINDNFGNNPHIGYGNYDNGIDFHSNMKEPFKYSAENDYFYSNSSIDESYKINFNDSYKNCVIKYTEGKCIKKEGIIDMNGWAYSDYIHMIPKINTITINNQIVSNYENFGIETYDKDYKKIRYIPYKNRIENNITLNKGEIYIRFCFPIFNLNKVSVVSDNIEIWKAVNDNNIDYSKIHIIKDDSYNNYYINDKTLEIINYHSDSICFNNFFKKNILPYVMQVIPSTTILHLKGF